MYIAYLKILISGFLEGVKEGRKIHANRRQKRLYRISNYKIK